MTLTQRIRHIHPGLILASLDFLGLCIASYLAIVEVGGGTPVCGPLHGCETVASSPYSRIFGVPVAVFGVMLSLFLMTAALAWWRTGYTWLLAAHYVGSLVGVIFETYFTYLELFVIDAICIWCATYFVTLLVRFALSAWVWFTRPKSLDEGGADVGHIETGVGRSAAEATTADD
jgi:uncharacterized membrane protein